jgi:cyclic pyranopterin phosphate synthase
MEEPTQPRPILTDRFDRTHNYLRISLTDNCDLRCAYCMPEEDHDFTPAARLMQPAEVEAIARTFTALGVDKVRLTGGEPLVRKDAADIILRLSKLPVTLTLTTNGTRLHHFAGLLAQCGVRSLNISLDTLDPDRFLLLTRRNLFAQVKANIDRMLDDGFHVKVNTVVMNGVNDDEIEAFIHWTRDRPVHVRFIEFMPFTGNRWQPERVLGWQQILERASTAFDISPLGRDRNGTARAYQVPGHQGTFAVISTMTAPFCGDCNRMRLTADGKMKNCLFSQTETDLLTPFRSGQDITPLIHANVRDKKEALGGQFTAGPQQVDASLIENRSMITIGG